MKSIKVYARCRDSAECCCPMRGYRFGHGIQLDLVGPIRFGCVYSVRLHFLSCRSTCLCALSELSGESRDRNRGKSALSINAALNPLSQRFGLPLMVIGCGKRGTPPTPLSFARHFAHVLRASLADTRSIKIIAATTIFQPPRSDSAPLIRFFGRERSSDYTRLRLVA